MKSGPATVLLPRLTAVYSQHRSVQPARGAARHTAVRVNQTKKPTRQAKQNKVSVLGVLQRLGILRFTSRAGRLPPHTHKTFHVLAMVEGQQKDTVKVTSRLFCIVRKDFNFQACKILDKVVLCIQFCSLRNLKHARADRDTITHAWLVFSASELIPKLCPGPDYSNSVAPANRIICPDIQSVCLHYEATSALLCLLYTCTGPKPRHCDSLVGEVRKQDCVNS